MLLLIREGKRAQATPAELRARTGAEQLDDAFLRLIEQRPEPSHHLCGRRTRAPHSAETRGRSRSSSSSVLLETLLRLCRAGPVFQHAGPPLLRLFLS
jgi:hypothetical protein